MRYSVQPGHAGQPITEAQVNRALSLMAGQPCMACGTDPAGGAAVVVHAGKALVAPLCPTCMADPVRSEQAGALAFERLEQHVEGLRRRQQSQEN